MKCPKCNAEMESGVVMTLLPGGSVGPINAWSTGIKSGPLSLGVTALENKKEVRSFRCKSCGYLESYAR